MGGKLMKKNDLPEWVLVHKERGQTIKVRKEKYYLYQEKCQYDKNRKHKNFTKNIYLGRITKENGFIPKKTLKAAAPETYSSKVYGAYRLIHMYCGDILERLRHEFGEYYGALIFTIASLRTIEKTPYKDLDDAYNETYFSVLNKNLSMSKSSLSDFLNNLAKHKDKFKAYMRKDIENDDTLVFDGTNLLCGSQNISYSGAGYKHGHNYKSQVNALYAYSSTKRKLVYYKLFEGSVSDGKSLPDMLEEMGAQGGIGVLDNGFHTDDSVKGLLKSKTKYIIALRRGSSYVKQEILDDSSRGGAKEKFINNHEAVFAYEVKGEGDNRICVYFNQAIMGVETAEYLDKMGKGWKGYTEDNFKNARGRFGIYVIKTNLADFSLQKIYEYYKSRFEIEYSFDTLKNTLEFDKVYMNSDNSLESWMFINHISITVTQRIYDTLKEKEVTLSLRSAFKKLRQIIKQRSIYDKDETYVSQVIPAKTKKIAEKLGILD
jgi:hypothetical protein